MAMADSQKKGKASSGGQRIDDHSFWAGGPGKDMVMPQGAHTKNESSAEGAGSEMDYEDTTEKVKAQQVEGVKQIKSRPMKPLYRN
jgi:hypothetical protein